MLNVPVNEFKKKIEFYLKQIKKGETFIIKEEEKSIAKIAPINSGNDKKRPMGLAKNDFIVPNDFDTHLPSEIQNLFE